MFGHRVAFAALSGLALVSAQANSNSTFKIDPSQVSDFDKSTWCGAQQDSCGTLCGSVLINNCDTTTLDFECECAGPNFPDMNKFMNTMPWFVCTELQKECIINTQNDLAGQKNCTATFQDHCGTEDVQDHKGEGALSPTTTSSASSQSQPTKTAAPTSSTSHAAAAAPTAHMQYFGNGVAAAAIGLLAYAL